MKNNGILFEMDAIRKSATGKKDSDVSRDYVTDKGTRIEVKFFHVEPTDNYKKGHSKVYAANGHSWKYDDNGNIDYLLTVQSFVDECDILKIGVGESWDNCEIYWLRTKKEIYAFYFTRLQFKKGESTCRLCYNPIAKKGGGMKSRLNTLRENGILNVPTESEIENAYIPFK